MIAGLVPAISAIAPTSAGATPATGTTYTPGTARLATITNGTSAAPWNEWQGDPSAAPYASVAPGTVLPTYTPGGASTGSGASAEPNIAIMSGATSGTDGNSPYPSGTVGTPGPLDGYCGTGNQVTESAGTPARQPNGTTLPIAPAYFPRIVANSDGSLTGYFDYRPKDADEAIVAGRSTDGGASWTYQGEALEQNAGYCPSSDINDDGQGHPFVLSVGGVSRLYTLQRSAGDNLGVGMTVHTLAPTAANPLAGVPTSEKVGIDPNTFVAPGGALTVPHTGGVTISVGATGTAGSPQQLIAGGFVDLTQTPTPVASSVITCTAVGATTLTGCTAAATTGESIAAGDLIEQVIGFVGGAVTVPTGPNTTTGDGGLGTVNVVTTSGGTTKGFTNSITGTTYNSLAPNRAYINGQAVYCSQANANPTTKMEFCTTGPGAAALSVAAGAPITSDPILPVGASQTNGLVAPDGIVGVLPGYPGAPAGATVVMYTEKVLNYYVAGTTTNSAPTAFTSSIAFTPSPSTPLNLPASISAATPVTVSIGDNTSSTIVPITCTGLTTGATDTLTGCSGFVAGDKYSATSLIGAPGAAVVPAATLALTGEGSTSTAKLFKNSEDLTVLRVAYTTDGINFSTSGLDNSGIVSGASGGSSSYSDVTNPALTQSPSNLNAYATPGTADAIELRYVGSAGSIITNPDGSYGLFLSGAWAADGDSDAFNQIFYASSTDGEHWSIPTTVVSTDYTFSASVAQDAALASGSDQPLGISAYYSGRAYGPSVVQNANGTLTMLFAGYRLPKTIANAGTVLGTNSAAQYTVGASDPAAYRNILTETLTSSTGGAVATSTAVTASPSTPVAGDAVTYTATVAVTPPGTGTPTGSVTFSGTGGTLCTAVALTGSTPDTASCTVTYPSSGTDTVTATYAGDANYATSSGTITETISTRPSGAITFSPPSSGTYGGSAVLSATGGGSSAPVTFTVDATSDPGACALTGATVSYTGIGSCVIDANQAGDATYQAPPQVQATITVGAAPLTVTASDATITYGSATPTITASYSGFVNGDDAAALTTAPTCSTTVGSTSPVGTYASTCSDAVDPDYSISYVPGVVTVSAATLLITASDGSTTYGSTTPVVITPSYSGFVNGDDTSVLTTAPTCGTSVTSATAAGQYDSTCTGAAAANYTIAYATGTVTVSSAALTISASDASTVYGSTAPTITPSYSGFVNGDDATALTVAPTCGTTAAPSSPVGQYASTCSGASDPNYTISYSAGVVSVVPATLTVTASDATTSYGSSAPVVTASYSGFVNGDDASALTTPPTCSTGVTATSPVGQYPSTCSGASDPNYAITYVNGTVTVAAAALTITASDASSTYGSAVPAITASYSGFAAGDGPASLTTAPVCSTTATASPPAGSYTSTCSGAVDPNYTISYTPGTVTVAPAALTVTASNATTLYGSTPPSISASYSGFVNGDTAASLTTPASCSANVIVSTSVGHYASTCAGAVDPNYTATYVPGTVTVVAVPLKITAVSVGTTYGSPQPVIGASYSGLVAGDTAASLPTPPTCSSAVTPTTKPGTYPATCSGAVDANYTITYAAGTVTVAQTPLTVTASSPTKVYGAGVPAITPTYSGFVNGETASSLTKAARCSTTTVNSSPVGTYPSTCTGAVDPNYAISYVPGVVSVVPAALKITASSTSTPYGSAPPTITPAYSGFVNGDTAAALTHPASCIPNITASSPVAKYASSCSGAVDANYTISYVAGTVSVTKVPLSISASNATTIYGTPPPVITASYAGFVNGETATALTTAPTCSTAVTASTSVGQYAAKCSGAVDGNYTISYVNGTVSVVAATITITATDVSYAASVKAKKATFTATVTNGSSGAPAKGESATFTVTVSSSVSFGCSATTNANGIATCTTSDLTDLHAATPGMYTVTVSASTNYQAGQAQGRLTS